MILFDNVDYCYPQTVRDIKSRIYVPCWSVPHGECQAMVGASGSGKTTLLQLAGGILKPNNGLIEIAKHSLTQMNEKRRRRFRLATIGFIFQSFELLPHLTVEENVLLPIRISHEKNITSQTRQRLDRLFSNLDLPTTLRNRRPDYLSQGERQRVAIGRALITQPSIVLADEPTGNLDQNLKESIVELLLEQCRENDATLIMATHDLNCIDKFDTATNTNDLLRWENVS